MEVRVPADEIDAALHVDRIEGRRAQRRFQSAVCGLPDGTFLALPRESGEAWLLWQGKLRRWTHAGYVEAIPPDTEVEVEVLTPRRTVEVLRAGYVPSVHPSAG